MGRGINNKHPFGGSIAALPTPIRNGEVDGNALRADIELHVAQGSQGLVLCGSTGESASMTLDERRQIWGIAVDQVAGRLPILAGVGAPSTNACLEMASIAVGIGVQGLLAVTPYYTVPDARGQVAHFEALAASQPKTPIILYNVPKRTGCDLQPATAHALASNCKNIVGIKEATRSIARLDALSGNSKLDIFAGDDLAMVDFLRRGAAGAITVIGNLLPRETAELIGLAAINPTDPRLAQLENKLAPLMACLTLAPNPVPLKAALQLQRDYPEEMRLPLVPAEQALRDRIAFALQQFETVELQA